MRMKKHFSPTSESIEDNYREPSDWTIITALDRVLMLAEDSRLSDEFWTKASRPLEFLKQQLGLTPIQIVILAIMVEKGESISWSGIGDFLDCSRLTIMTYSEEIEGLVEKRWAVHKVAHEMGSRCFGFKLAYGVVTALRNNKAFVPEALEGMTEQQFVERLESHMDKNINDRDSLFEETERWMLNLVKANPQLPICQELLRFEDIHTQSLLLLVIYDYAQWADSSQEGLEMLCINHYYPEDFECNGLRFRLREGTHELFTKGYIELKCEDGVADTDRLCLTRASKSRLLANYKPSRSQCMRNGNGNDRFLKSHSTIKEKPLFYNATEQQQIEQLTCMLSQERLPAIQQRLEEQGMHKGFACLFYGAPGTGKTETVLQIARQTGRDLMQVDIAGLRDKFVGESEKNIKEVFTRYRDLCSRAEVMPILFFNEADAIFNKRSENVKRSVDKMENAIQDIILQELENLEGILIATTNLTRNLDRAFERRFLFKVEFHKPGTDVKAKIWTSMLKELSPSEALQLAAHYDFSGGQIENVARKQTIDYVLYGQSPTLQDIEKYCRAELLSDGSGCRHIAGFTNN